MPAKKIYQVAASVNVRPKTVNLNDLGLHPTLANPPRRKRVEHCSEETINAWIEYLARKAGH